MNGSRRTSTLQLDRQVRQNPAPRIGKRPFLALSDKVNELEGHFTVAQETVDSLVELLEARAGFITVLPLLDLTYSKHVDQSEELLRFEETLAARGETVLPFFALESAKRMHRLENLLLVPIAWHGSIIGLLGFDLKGRVVTTNEETGLLYLANQLGAIFGLTIELMEGRQRTPGGITQAELSSVAAMQKHLLPSVPAPPTCGLAIATHTQSADYIGGDYFDLVIVDQNKMGIVIADVEGKGVPAALFSNTLRTTVHFLTRETPSTASVVGKINSILHLEAVALQKLFTLFYAVYDPANKILTYTGSAHLAPVLLRSGSDTVERLYSDGTLIGIEPTQRFTERSVRLETDDLVAFFTDGVIDHLNESGEAYGEDRLVQALQKHRDQDVEIIMQNLLKETSQFSSVPPADDLTVVLAKIL